MAAKRTRITERNKPGKGKDRLVPEKLTIQRLSAQVKASSQKYASWNGAFKKSRCSWKTTCVHHQLLML